MIEDNIMLLNTLLLFMGLVVLSIGLIGIFLLWQHPEVFSKNLRQEQSLDSTYYSIFDTRKNKIILFAGTFILALIVTPIYVGLTAGWNGESFSLAPAITITLLLYAFSPLSAAFFPAGLLAYFPPQYGLYWFVIVWAVYLVPSIPAILVKQRWLSMLLYFIFIIVLIVNIAGCAPVVLDALSGMN